MYKILKKTILISSISLLTFMACKKKEEAPTPAPAPITSFTWSENGGATVKADSAFFETRYNTIKAYNNNGTNFIEINLTAGTAATYTVSPSSNAISYLVGSNLYTASSGSTTISANALSKMSGSFTSTGSGASITSLSGTFNNISVR